jgi:hypothetical protein
MNNDIFNTKNYIIDGDPDGSVENDFFTQLKNILNRNPNDETNNHDEIRLDDDENNYCLLTKEPLDDIHIKLTCGHKFNYVPLYREVVMQKTTGMSSTGYYYSHSLKRNEIKCPYCRTVQDKLLPYLEYDGVNKTIGVNQPKTLSMSVQTCSHIEYKKGKKQSSQQSSTCCKEQSSTCCKEQSSTCCKEQSSTCCKENAIHFLNGAYLCKKHSLNITTNVTINADTIHATVESKVATDTCGVILRYGKNKGTPCNNSSKCRVHSSQ